MTRLQLSALFVLLFSVGLFAQTPTPVPPSDWYGSLTGIIALTMLLSSGLKRAIGNVAALNSIPMWIYVVLIAEGLTLVCVQVLHTLPGPLTTQIYQAFLLAASASGAYEWFFSGSGNATKPLAITAQSAGVRVDAVNMPNTFPKL